MLKRIKDVMRKQLEIICNKIETVTTEDGDIKAGMDKEYFTYIGEYYNIVQGSNYLEKLD